MRRIILSLLLSLPVFAAAQSDSLNVQQPTAVAATAAQPAVRFGYLSYDSALVAMPEYALARQSVAELRAKYDAEVKRVEDDFNTKYEQFLEGQKSFPETILRKRQNELQEIMERNVKFKSEAREQLRLSEEATMQPVHKKLAERIARLGKERGYAFILNTDNNSAPYINPMLGDDLNQTIRLLMRR